MFVTIRKEADSFLSIERTSSESTCNPIQLDTFVRTPFCFLERTSKTVKGMQKLRDKMSIYFFLTRIICNSIKCQTEQSILMSYMSPDNHVLMCLLEVKQEEQTALRKTFIS